MKKRILFCVLLCLYVSGCQPQSTVSDKSTVIESSPENNVKLREMAQEANEEYDSIEEFQQHSNKSPILLETAASRDTRTATNSNTKAGLEATVQRVSVGESYVDVYYDCTIGNETFKLRLGTYNSDYDESDMQTILGNNSGVFEEQNVDGLTVYYCPGMDIEKYNCYMMTLNDRLFVINIEKGYNSMIYNVIDYINH